MALLNTWASQQDQATLSPLSRLLNNYIQKGDAPLAYLMRGDAQGLLKDLNTPKPVNTTQDMTDLALNLVGSINPIGNVTKGLLSKTQFEKAQELASKNAETLLGLPKGNTAMERAKAMGYNVDKPVYHGTGADIKAFDPLLADTRRKTGTPTGSVVVSSSPDTASTYANMTSGEWIKNWGEGGNVIPMYLRNNKNLTVNAAEPNYTPNWNNLLIKRYPEIETTNELAALAKEMGKESATIKNIKDNAVMSSAEGNTTFVFKPELLRSQFAAFDPAKINENDLLAGVMAIPVSGLLEQPKDKKKKK